MLSATPAAGKNQAWFIIWRLLGCSTDASRLQFGLLHCLRVAPFRATWWGSPLRHAAVLHWHRRQPGQLLPCRGWQRHASTASRTIVCMLFVGQGIPVA